MGASIDPTPGDRPGGRRRLRSATLVAAPIFVVGLIAGTLLLASVLWGAWNDEHLGVAFWSVVVVSGAVAVVAFVAGRGCFIEVDDTTVRDVVGWVTVRRLAQPDIVTVRVRAGAWRWFEAELSDSSRHVLLGSGPAQFPARLLPGAREDDLAALDLIMGDD